MRRFPALTTRDSGRAPYAIALVVIAWLGQPARAAIPAPQVPGDIRVPEGNVLFLATEAVGTQNYICLPSGSGFAWTFVGPQATLFNAREAQITTHFLSPNPDEGGTPRATWQSSLDTSAVWAQAIVSSTDPNFVEPGAIPWLLLQVVGSQAGPNGGLLLTRTTYIQRVNTSGGVMPPTGCAEAADTGRRAFVPYGANYLFWRRQLR
jgi:hypothetical protein